MSKNNENAGLQDDIIREMVHKELDSEVEDIFMNDELKERIILSVSHQSLFARMRTSIYNFLNCEIPIPFHIAAFCLAITITVGGFILSESFRVTSHDIEAARIHIESSGEGDTYESSQN